MIIIFNGVCNYGVVIAELLGRYSIPCKLYTIKPITKEYLKQFSYIASHQIVINNRTTLKNDIKLADLCINVSMGAIDCLGIKRLLYCLFVRKLKFISVPTGSDLSELEIQTPIRKILFLIIFKYGTTHLPHYTNCIGVYLKYKLEKYFFAKHPYIFQKKIPNRYYNQEIVFLHPSNLDWGETDNKVGRNSFKGNDAFLKAFARASRHLEKRNIFIKCRILYRGPDKDVAIKLICRESAERFFEWVKPTTTVKLIEYFSQSDVVIDQFNLGILGMIAMEAMAQAKPVMIHIDKNCWPLVYDEEPPVINCHTEDEIYQAILAWSDRKKLQALGERAEKWVRKYHDVHTADFSEFILRICLAAGLEWPRVDLSKSAEMASLKQAQAD